MKHIECQCEKCKSSCSRKPGAFTPDEVFALAKNMNLTVKELFVKHLSVDYYGDGETIFYLTPALKKNTPGKVVGFNNLGECSFFHDGLCDIHAIGKPNQCKYSSCKGRDNRYLDNKEIAKTWLAYQDLIKDLCGGDLEEPELTIGDGFDFLLSLVDTHVKYSLNENGERVLERVEAKPFK